MERSLVERAARGDEEAFALLARASGDQLLAIAYRILRDLGLAEDAVQLTLVTAWRRLPTLREPDRFEAWLRRLLVHTCYREARRTHRWAGAVRVIATVDPAYPDAARDVLDRDQLERGFRRLSAEHRAVVVFHHYLGLTLPEIAAELDIPLGTVKSRLHYAVNALRAAIDADQRMPDDLTQERLA